MSNDTSLAQVPPRQRRRRGRPPLPLEELLQNERINVPLRLAEMEEFHRRIDAAGLTEGQLVRALVIRWLRGETVVTV